VGDAPGAPFDRDGYRRAVAEITARGGTPVIFQSYGLTSLPDAELIAAYELIGHECDSFIALTWYDVRIIWKDIRPGNVP